MCWSQTQLLSQVGGSDADSLIVGSNFGIKLIPSTIPVKPRLS